jgi:ribonuclease HIII
MALNSYTSPIDSLQVNRLKQILIDRGFEIGEKPYAFFSAKKEKIMVTVYEKGPKVLVQGRETEDFVKFIFEPEILGEAILGNEEIHHPEMFEAHIGVDESGKGDFFGPLVTAGVYVNREIVQQLLELGVADSKKLTDSKIKQLYEKIIAIKGIGYEVITLRPEKYNEMYQEFGNLNRLLAWCHARVIASLLKKFPTCPRAFSDQFARTDLLQSAVAQQGIDLSSFTLQQETKAERDFAVAAASILARRFFVDWLDRASAKGGVELPLGAGPHVLPIAYECVKTYGQDILPKLVKTHFKTFKQITY